MSAQTGRRAIVVGASSGIGEAIAERLARGGWQVAAVARRVERLRALAKRVEEAGAAGSVRPVAHDARAAEEVAGLFERLVGDLHGLDLLVYASGVMPAVGPDEYDREKDRAMVETNLLGAMAWGNEAARWLGAQGSGAIVGISSIAGERGRKGSPGYCASKAALDSYLESLRNRLTGRGVHVLTLKPGFVRTPMLEGRAGTFWVCEPEEVAERMLRALRRRSQKIYVWPRWRLVAWAVRFMPHFLFRRLSI